MPDVDVRPPIPQRLLHRPIVGGLVQPWINVALHDGGVDFRAQHHARTRQALIDSLCQVCGERLTDMIVLLGGPAQLAQNIYDEPPLHPECASYARKACPMLAGRMTTFATGPSVSERERGRRCYLPDCDCGGWVPTPGLEPTVRQDGAPAHPWYAVFANDYAVVITDQGVPWGARPRGRTRVVLVSDPLGEVPRA